jgi:hypothetical protein
LNYYYQGQVDNCVMGGFANAVFWFSGPESSDTLLKDFSLSITKFWFHFVTHVNRVLKNYVLKKYNCDDILNMDDGSPVVVQLRSGDKSILFYPRQRRPWIGVVDSLVLKHTCVFTDWNTKKGKRNNQRRKRPDARLLFDGRV